MFLSQKSYTTAFSYFCCSLSIKSSNKLYFLGLPLGFLSLGTGSYFISVGIFLFYFTFSILGGTLSYSYTGGSDLDFRRLITF